MLIYYFLPTHAPVAQSKGNGVMTEENPVKVGTVVEHIYSTVDVSPGILIV